MGSDFDNHQAVQDLIHDARYFPMLLYPGRDAIDLSDRGALSGFLDGRQLLVILLDATWRSARRMFNRSPSLQRLPRLGIMSGEKSRYLIKKQPHDWCLSTIEAAHELMKALDRAGLDSYARPDQMLDLFDRMQQHQISCMQDPARQNYRRGKAAGPGSGQ